MKNILLSILMLGCLNSLYAQDCVYKVSGVVIDDHTGEHVPNAKLFIKNSSVKSVSDSLGNFLLSNICLGEIQLICIHHVGCEPYKVTFNVLKDTSLVIRTETHFIDFGEVNFDFFVLDRDVISTTKLSEMERFNTSGKSMGEQLESLSGVSTLKTGNSIAKPVIHGLHSNRVILLNNGIRQEGQQWGSEHAPEVDPFLNNDLSVIKGAGALRYGPEAIGGVIFARPAPWSEKTGWSGNGFTSFSSNGRQVVSGLLIENNSKKIKGLSFRGHVSAKKGGTVSAPEYIVNNTGVKELNFSAASRYIRGKHSFEIFYSRFYTELGIFSGSHIGNLTDLQAAIDSDLPAQVGDFSYDISSPKQVIEHNLTKLSTTNKWSEKISTKIDFGFQQNDRQEFDTDSFYGTQKDTTIADFRLKLFTYTLDIEVNQKFSKSWKLAYGIQALRQGNERAGRYLVPNFYKNQIGAFSIVNLVKNDWSFEGGLRYDAVQLSAFLFEDKKLINPKNDYGDFSSTIGVSRIFGHHFVLKSNVGYAWRPPSISELYSEGLHHGAAAIERGDRSIGQEVSLQGNVSGVYKSKRLSVQLDLYHLQFLNFIYLKPQNELELTIKGAFPSFQYEEVKARFSGVDLTLDYKLLKKLSLQTKYSMVRAINLSDGNFLVGIPSDNLTTGLQYSHTFKKEQVLTAGVSVNYVFEQNRFDENADYSNPPIDYALVNGNLSYSFKMNKGVFRLGLVVENGLNKEYRNYMNRFRYYTAEMGRNISVKINYQFK